MENQIPRSKVEDIFGDTPRNDWERKETNLIKVLHDYVYKDVRSVDAFCELIYFYREEIARRKLLVEDIKK